MSLDQTLLHSQLLLNERHFYLSFMDRVVLQLTEVGGVRRGADGLWCCQARLVSGPVLAVLSWCPCESPRQSPSRAVTLPGHATFSHQSPKTALSTGYLRSHHLHLIDKLFLNTAVVVFILSNTCISCQNYILCVIIYIIFT